jgi:hypothetical protein
MLSAYPADASGDIDDLGADDLSQVEQVFTD